MGDQFLPGLETFKHHQTHPNIGSFTNHFPPGPELITNNVHPLTPFPFPQSPANPGFFIQDDIVDGQARRKRKPTEINNSPGNSPANSSPQASDNVKKKSLRRGKKAKGNGEMEEIEPKEVVHVRAKRGQATDSHSLAERVRREKINERLRCLQDIVPGCYKTMGMAVMLDEIINYVQSLQNQVEFLSLKLTAASTFYDFNSETDALEAMQRAKAFHVIKAQNGTSPGLTSTTLNFNCYPQLPHDT